MLFRSGGYHDRRHLLIAGYWTDIDQSCDERYVMPEDSMNRVILSVHYYTPSTFAIAESDTGWGYRETWGTEEDYKELNAKFDLLKKTYVDQGIPVIIGEFGSTIKNKELASVANYIASVMRTALERDMCPILWDPGNHVNR